MSFKGTLFLLSLIIAITRDTYRNQSASIFTEAIDVSCGTDSNDKKSMAFTGNWSQYVKTPATFDRKTLTNKFTLSHWFGRLGNNFMQIKTALRYAICCGGRLEIKYSHSELKHLQRYLDFSGILNTMVTSGYEPPRECGRTWNSDFFEPINKFPVPKCVFDEYAAIQYFVFGNNYSYLTGRDPRCSSFNIKCDPSLMEDTLVVHIRSGDIFSPGGAQENYKQPPVSFYQSIFRRQHWSRIIFVTSLESPSLWNPVWLFFLNETNRINSFIDSSTSVTFQMSSSIQEDMKTLWCAQHYVAPFSTFAQMLFFSSPWLRHFFVTGMGDCRGPALAHPPNATCHRILLPGYKMFGEGKWTNSAAQREEMLLFPLEQVKEDLLIT